MNKNTITKINQALENVEMPDNIKKLLIELRDDIPHAKTFEEKTLIFLRWAELITNTIGITQDFFN